MKSEYLSRRRNGALWPRREFSLVPGLDKNERQSVWIEKRKRSTSPTGLDGLVANSRFVEARLPEIESTQRNRQRNLDAQADARADGGQLGPRKESDVRSRVTDGVGIEEMVRAR